MAEQHNLRKAYRLLFSFNFLLLYDSRWTERLLLLFFLFYYTKDTTNFSAWEMKGLGGWKGGIERDDMEITTNMARSEQGLVCH